MEKHPIVGGLYRIDTVLLSVSDPKPKCPAVVIAVPVGLPDVSVVTRTSDTTVQGLRHPASPALTGSPGGKLNPKRTKWDSFWA